MLRRKSSRVGVALAAVTVVSAAGVVGAGAVRGEDADGAVAATQGEWKESFCVPVSYTLLARTTREPGLQIRCGQVTAEGFRYFGVFLSRNYEAQGERIAAAIAAALDQQRPLVVRYRFPQPAASIAETLNRASGCFAPHHERDCAIADGIGLYKK